MFVQFRHVEFNEKFYLIEDAVSIHYIKKNHGRALIVAPGRPQYKNFKKNQVCVIATKKTIENAWMEVKYPGYYNGIKIDMDLEDSAYQDGRDL